MTMLLKASTNVVRYFMMRLVADGKAAAGLTITTFDLQYTRELTATAAKTDGIVGTGGATTHVDNKVFELEATDSPGLYMVCFPDAAFATGVDQVTLNLTYDSTVFTEAQTIQLVAFNPFDGVRLGLTSLANAAADAPGGFVISDAGGQDYDAMQAAAIRLTAVRAAVLTDWIDGQRLDLLLDAVNTVTPDAAGTAPTVSEITTELNANLALKATALDLVLKTSTFAVAMAAAHWDRVISQSNHNIGQSAGKILRQSGDISQINGAIVDGSPTTTDFDTDLTQVDGYFDDALMVFTNGAANAGIGKYVSLYVNTNGNVTFIAGMAWPVTPVNGDDFTLYGMHAHSVSEIQSGLATTADLLDKLGAVNESAAAGDPSATESVMQYVKQTINILTGTAGIATMPAAAAPANNVSIAEMIRAIYDDTNEAQGKLPTNKFMGSSDGADDDGTLNELTSQGDTNETKLDTIAGYIDTEIAALLSDVAAVLVDTNATLDAKINSIKTVTDKFVFTIANEVDANTKSINDVTITGDGSATPFDV